MKTRFLFPHSYKRIGWLLTVPMLVYGIIYLIKSDLVVIKGFHISFPSWWNESYFHENNLTDELIVTLLTTGLLLVGFSREKIEDEWVAKVRLESLQWGVLINAILLILFTLLIYGPDYFTVLYINMFSALVLFVIRFNTILYVKPYLEKTAERRSV